VSDHGEGLYECATCFGHGDNLKSMLTLRVPLAFRLPKALFPEANAGRHDAYVSQLDIYPTLLSLLGQAQMAHHEGRALLTQSGQLEQLPPRTHFAESGEWLWPTPAVPADRLRYPVVTEMAKLERGRIVIDSKYNAEIRAAKHRAVIRPPYKLSYEPGASGVRYALYDFEKDPLETTDLAPSQPELVAELKRSLSRSMLRHPQVLEVADYFLSRPPPPPPEAF
jgi:arylsulfatase A-like enzyme